MLAGLRKTMHPARATRIVRVAGLTAVAMALVLNAGCERPAPVVVAAPPTTATVAPDHPASAPEPIVNSIGMWLTHISPGEFVMGSPADEVGHDPDETQHKVRITKPFLLGMYPVTQSQYSAIMGNNPSYFRGDDFPAESRGDLPVDTVSWEDAMAFCKKLSEKEGKKYRLPTEAEREYASRAGSTGPFAGDANLEDIGWILINSAGTTHPVGTLRPNDWGLYDMQGNVWEWCSDWYGPYPTGDAVDPTGPDHGITRVLRGGCMEYDQEHARTAFRNFYPPDAQLYYIGFRVALDSP